MKHKLSEIINTDCYIQFDTNEQLREWVKQVELQLSLEIDDCDIFIRFFDEWGTCCSTDRPFKDYPIHHHTNIEI